MTRELDAQVARARGWTEKEIDGQRLWDTSHTKRLSPTQTVSSGILTLLPRFSTDIAAAMGLEPRMSYFRLRRLAPNRWQCQSAWCGDPFDHLCDSCGCLFGDAPTAPEAICRAFLKAVGE